MKPANLLDVIFVFVLSCRWELLCGYCRWVLVVSLGKALNKISHFKGVDRRPATPERARYRPNVLDVFLRSEDKDSA